MHVSHLDAADAFVTLDGSTIRAGDCVVIAPGAIHKLTSIGDEPLKLLCCCAPAYSDDDTVLTGG